MYLMRRWEALVSILFVALVYNFSRRLLPIISPYKTSTIFAYASVVAQTHGDVDPWMVKKAFTLQGHEEAMKLREIFNSMMYSGKSNELLQQFDQIQSKYDTLYVDDDYPSLYGLQGVLLFYMNRRKEAYESLRRAVAINPKDLRSLVNLVDVGRSFSQAVDDSVELVERLTGRQSRHQKATSANWELLEMDQYIDNKHLYQCVYEHRNEDICDYELVNVNIIHFPPPLWRAYLEFSANCSQNDLERHVDMTTLYDSSMSAALSTTLDQIHNSNKTKLRVGFLLIANDLNPVNILSYSLIKHLPRNRIRLYGFFLNGEDSTILHDWQEDFYNSFDEVINLDGLDRLVSYHMIHDQCQIDILIEMNGMSLNAGIAIMMHQPAPIQMTFLGDPITSGLNYIDYFLGDPQSISVESMIDGFSEKLMLLPTCYLVTSHAISQRHIPTMGRIPRDMFAKKYLGYPNQRINAVVEAGSKNFNHNSTLTISSDKDKDDSQVVHMNGAIGDVNMDRNRDEVTDEHDLLRDTHSKTLQQLANDTLNDGYAYYDDDSTPLFVGAFHGWTKLDPSIFQVWMNILQQSPRDILLLQSDSKDGFGNLQYQMQYYGINPKIRASYIVVTPFREHLYVKSAIDLYLDTIVKNGHTTTMDAHWAGLPTVVLGGRPSMMSRSSLSAAYYNKNDFGVVYSLKEYEDFVLRLIKTKEGRRLLHEWRKYTEKQRIEGKLFDTQYFATEFAYLLEAVYDIHELKSKKANKILSRGRGKACEDINSSDCGKENKFHVFATNR